MNSDSKNGDSRSQHLLRHQPLPHQDRFLELHTIFTNAGVVSKFVGTSETRGNPFHVELTQHKKP